MLPAGVGGVGGRGGTPGSHGPFRWVGRSRWGFWGAAGGGDCGLCAPSGFLGGGFFEGSGGSRGKGGSGEEVGAWRRLTLRFGLSAPHSETGPQIHSFKTPPRQSQTSSFPMLLQASNFSAATIRRTWPSQCLHLATAPSRSPQSQIHSSSSWGFHLSLGERLTFGVFTHLLLLSSIIKV